MSRFVTAARLAVVSAVGLPASAPANRLTSVTNQLSKRTLILTRTGYRCSGRHERFAVVSGRVFVCSPAYSNA